MEVIIQEIKNGFVLLAGEDVVYCKSLSETHKEIEFLFGVKAPEKPDISNDGVRQFSDED